MEVAKLYATVGADVGNAQKGLRSVDVQLQKTAKDFKAIEKNKITADTSQAESGLKRLAGVAGSTRSAMSGIGSAVSTALGTFAGNLLTAGFSKVTGGIGDIIERGLDMNDVLERSRIGFTTMLGSAEKANAKIAELQQFAATTPFEFKGLVQNSQLLLGMGFTGEELIPTLTAVGNALSAMGKTENLDRVLLQLGQMRAKGKVAAQEINVIAENGIPVWQILSERVGLSVQQLQKLGEEGKLNAEVFQKLFFEGAQARYGGSLELASQTRTGKLSNLQDLLDKRAAESTRGLDAELKTSIENTTKFLEGPGGKALADSINVASETAAIAFNQGIAGLLNNGQVIAQITETGGKVATGFSDGVVKNTDKAVSAATGLYNQFIGAVDSLFDIHSPSRVMIVRGQEVAEGFIQGLESKRSEIIATMARVFGQKGAESLFNKGVLFGPGFFTSGNAQYDQAIAQYSKSRGIDPVTQFAQLLQESRFNPNARSGAGAQGLAQFIPDTARRFGLNPSDPVDSIRANADYMRQLLDKFSAFSNKAELALAGYNAGENRPGTLGRGVVPNIPETQNYVRIIDNISEVIRSGVKQSTVASTEKIVADLKRVIAEGAVREFDKSLSSGAFRAGSRDPFSGSGSVAGVPNFLELAGALPSLSELENLTIPTQTIAANLKDIHIGFAPVLEDYSQLNKLAEQTTKATTISTQEQKKNLQLLTGAQTSAMATFAKSAQGIFQDAFATLFEEGFGGFARKLLQGFTELILQLVAKALATKLIEKLFGGSAGGAAGGGGGFDFSKIFDGLFKSLSGVFKGLFGFFGALFGGKSFGGLFADGGPVSSNRSYIVGERGPEIFVPNTAGMILPNQALAGAGSGNVVNQYISYHVPSTTGTIARESQTQTAARSAQMARRALERNE